MLEKLAKKNSDKVRIVKVDVSVHREWARDEGIRGIPTFQIYRAGKRVDQFAGAPPEHILQGKIDHHAAKLVAKTDAAQDGDKEGAETAADPAIKPMPKEWLPPGVTRQ